MEYRNMHFMKIQDNKEYGVIWNQSISTIIKQG